MELVKSVYDNQYELLAALLRLYVPDGIDADVTYSKGMFYRHGIPEPEHKYDLNPSGMGVMYADCRKLPIPTGWCRSLIFDPPFVAAGRKKYDTGKIAERFTKYPGNMDDLWGFYSESLMEFYRVLSLGGVLIFKCQDVVAGGKNYFSHIFIANAAEAMGFVLKDLFVLTTNRRLGQWNLKRQIHARKYHCYFMVFKR
jgi:hypothetical protein